MSNQRLSKFIMGRSAVALALTANTAAATDQLQAGSYDVWCDQDCFVRVAKTTVASPDRPQDVTTANGYPVKANTVVTLDLANDCGIGAIAAANATFKFHRIA